MITYGEGYLRFEFCNGHTSLGRVQYFNSKKSVMVRVVFKLLDNVNLEITWYYRMRIIYISFALLFHFSFARL